MDSFAWPDKSDKIKRKTFLCPKILPERSKLYFFNWNHRKTTFMFEDGTLGEMHVGIKNLDTRQ